MGRETYIKDNKWRRHSDREQCCCKTGQIAFIDMLNIDTFCFGITVYCLVLLFTCITFQNAASRPSNQRREVLFWNKEKSC